MVSSNSTVDKMGVANAKRPMRRVSPSLIAASHKKNAPPKGPKPSTAIHAMSWVVNAVEGSNSAWHSKDSPPEAAAKPPTAAVGNVGSLRVSSE